MADFEHYTASESKTFSEFKSYKAEIYSKPQEIMNKAEEILKVPEIPNRIDKENIAQKTNTYKTRESTRSKVKELFEGIKNSTVKIVGTVSATVVVAASTLIIMPEVVDIPTFGDTPPQIEEVLPPIEEPAAPQYTATINADSINNPTMIWGEETNVITLDNLFIQGDDEACAYRVTLLNENGGEIMVVEDVASGLTLEIPASEDYLKIVVEEIYRGEADTLVFGSIEAESYISLSEPTISFLDNKVLSAEGYYLIPYIIESNLQDKEEYISLELYIDGWDEPMIIQDIVVNEETYAKVSMDNYVGDFTISARLTLMGAYGGNERVVSTERTYINEAEISLSDVYFSHGSYGAADQIFFNLAYAAPEGSYLVLIDKDSGEEIVPYEYGEGFYIEVDEGVYNLFCRLVSPDGEILYETETFSFNSEITSTYDEFNYDNPSEVTITYNDDGTINVYIDTGFASSDPGVYYEIVLNGEAYKFTEPLAKIESIANDTYSLIYRICVDDENGVKYVINEIAPSGMVNEVNIPVSLESTDEGVLISISYNYDRVGEEMLLSVNGEESILINKSDMQYSEEYYTYTYLLPFDGVVEVAELSLECTYNSDYEYMVELYGADTIKGNKFTTYTLEYTKGE